MCSHRSDKINGQRYRQRQRGDSARYNNIQPKDTSTMERDWREITERELEFFVLDPITSSKYRSEGTADALRKL